MKTPIIARTRLAAPLALLWLVVSSAAVVPAARSGLTVGDYQRAILVSWDGVSRDVLLELLEVSDPATPCWSNGDVFPLATGRLNAQGAPVFTCLAALGGAKPSDAPAESPAYGPFQILASHTTDDGATMTKPQHASMLSGYNTESHGITKNVSKVRMPEGITIYEKLMDAFDPLPPGGRRNGFLFRTHHSGDRKYVGKALHYWAKRSRALQVKTSAGNSEGERPGALRYAARSFERWRLDAEARGLADPAFFMFLHFKSTDWAAHRNGEGSRQYRRAVVQTDRKLYTLMKMLRQYGWEDTAILVTTDHGFHRGFHVRNGGRTVFNTWMGAYNVHLSVDHIPMRTPADYCASHADPQACLADGPKVPMPAEDVVPNVYVTSVVPTLLDMFGVEWRTTSQIEGQSLYRP